MLLCAIVCGQSSDGTTPGQDVNPDEQGDTPDTSTDVSTTPGQDVNGDGDTPDTTSTTGSGATETTTPGGTGGTTTPGGTGGTTTPGGSGGTTTPGGSGGTTTTGGSGGTTTPGGSGDTTTQASNQKAVNAAINRIFDACNKYCTDANIAETGSFSNLRYTCSLSCYHIAKGQDTEFQGFLGKTPAKTPAEVEALSKTCVDRCTSLKLSQPHQDACTTGCLYVS